MARFSYFGAAAMRQLRSMGCLTKWVSAKAASTVHSAASTKCSWRLSTATSRPYCKQTSTICGVDQPAQRLSGASKRSSGSNPPLKPAFFRFARSNEAEDQLVRMRVRRGLELLEEAYRDTIVRGQEAGQFATDADARVLSTFLVANLYGLQVLGRANIALDARTKTLATIMKALA